MILIRTDQLASSKSGLLLSAVTLTMAQCDLLLRHCAIVLFRLISVVNTNINHVTNYNSAL